MVKKLNVSVDFRGYINYNKTCNRIVTVIGQEPRLKLEYLKTILSYFEGVLILV